MSPQRLTLFVSFAAMIAFPALAGAAMYKWVDEHGTTHYGDSVPPKYASRAVDRKGKPVVPPARVERSEAAATAPAEAQSEQQRAEAKRQLARERQDMALLSTYANENEIEQARQRELARVQDLLKINTAGLARSDKPGDRKKLEAYMERTRRETDGINARFDAQLARYREITQNAAPARSADAAGRTAPVK